jgi:hypothetical protein
MSPNRLPARLATARAALSAAAATVALATAAVAPQAASAAPMPRLQTADFTVAVKATQTTSWTLGGGARAADCSPLVRFSGSGRETTRFAFPAKRYTGLRVNKAADLVVKPGKDGFAPTGWAVTTRAGREEGEEIAGSCGDNPARRTASQPTDCGSRRQLMTPIISFTGNRMRLRLEEGLPAPLVPPRYERCPLHAPSGVEEVGITAVPSLERFAPTELFGSFRQHVLLARRTFRTTSGNVRATTTVSWTATVTRVGKVR